MKLLTNKDLANWFERINERFFSDRLDSSIEVRFATSETDQDELGDDCDGSYNHDDRVILIDKKLRGYPRVVEILVLHEMIHAEFPDHISQSETEDHGTMFQHRLVELFHQGAYDGLL